MGPFQIKIRINILFAALAFSSAVQLKAQNNSDSLFHILVTGDGSRITKLLTSYPIQLVSVNPLKVIDLADSALRFSSNIKNKDVYTKLLRTKAIALTMISDYDSSRKILDEAMKIREESGLTSESGKFYLNYGHTEALSSHFHKAIEYYQSGMKAAEKENNKEDLAYGYTNLAILNFLINEPEKAMRYNEKALKIVRENNYTYLLGDVYQHYVIMYIGLGDLNTAMKYAEMAAEAYKLTGNKIGLGGIYDNTGLILGFLGKDNESINYFKKSLEIREEISDLKGVASSYINIASALIDLNRVDEGLKYLNDANALIGKYNDQRQLSQSLNKLSVGYEKKGNYIKALEYYKKFKASYDSVFSGESIGRILRVEAQHLNEQKQKEIESLRAMKEKDDQIRLFLILAIIFVGVAAFAAVNAFLFKRKAHQNLGELNRQLLKKTEELELLNEELKSLNQDKDKFFSVIAHDLRSPFFALLGNSELLAHDIDIMTREQISEFSHNTLAMTRNIYSLLENLLAWSTYSTGRIKFNPAVFDAAAQIMQIIEVSRVTASQKSIRIQFNPDGEYRVNSDKEIINLVVRNLVSNSVKFTPAGGKIDLHIFRSSDNTVITVSDTGSGIPEESLLNMFTNKINSTRGTENEKGTGLGLMLCKDMADLIGGKISAENLPGGGARFTFVVPDRVSPGNHKTVSG